MSQAINEYFGDLRLRRRHATEYQDFHIGTCQPQHPHGSLSGRLSFAYCPGVHFSTSDRKWRENNYRLSWVYAADGHRRTSQEAITLVTRLPGKLTAPSTLPSIVYNRAIERPPARAALFGSMRSGESSQGVCQNVNRQFCFLIRRHLCVPANSAFFKGVMDISKPGRQKDRIVGRPKSPPVARKPRRADQRGFLIAR